MDIYYESQKLLDQSGYRTIRMAEKDWVVFEDESLFGFISVAKDAHEILDSWEQAQDLFLATNAIHLRSFPTKAWNVYSVFLSDAECSLELRAQLILIEENFRGTRKIVQFEVTSQEEVFSALAPLLPIKNLVTLKEVDSLPMLESRLSFLKPSELSALRKTEVTPSVIEILLEEE